ncbi:MAG: GIY-YIG nuclease family protein [bacterium]
MSQLVWVKIANNKTNLAQVPLLCGVYRYWAGDKIIYVGKSVTLKARLNGHAQNARFDSKERAIVTGATHVDYTTTDNEFKALLLEAELIKKHQPVYNRVLKDDKSYLYIVINIKDKFPKPKLLRATDLNSQSTTYNSSLRSFGPFPSTQIAESVLKSIRRLIPFCIQKSVGKRSCFYSHLGLCSPCPSMIDQLFDADEKRRLQKLYRHNIFRILKILEGNIKPVIKALTVEMSKASKKNDYENALIIRNKINSFEQYINTHSFSDKRILSYHSADSALTSLRLHLGLGDGPLGRIECYDASHSAFSDAVVAMVVATDGELDRGQYRRFRLKRVTNKSDFDQLEEALIRRLRRSDWPRPDLLVIDGGAPQLRKLQMALDQIENPPMMIGLAKHPDHLVIPHFDDSNRRSITYKNVELPLNDHGFNLLQSLRDEAHRFGNQYRIILEKKIPR